ncbi:MAG: ArdC family protein, partial [Angelakisella sp.]
MAEQRDERMAELTQKLEQGVKDVFSSDRYRDYLNTMSKFHRYSFRNSILIHLQKPDATYVAGFNAWKTMERSVSKGEKGIQILAPAPYKKTVMVTQDERGNPLPEPEEKEVTVTAFRPAYVFDVSQTQGKELPRLVTQLAGQVVDYDKLLHGLWEAAPCPVAFEDIKSNANGYYQPEENRIAIKMGMSQEQTIKTTIHEIAHAKFEHGIETDRQMAEVQAESVAYVVCQHFGIDSSQYSFGYVASWSQGKDSSILKDCLASIQTVAKDIIGDVEISTGRDRTMEREVSQGILKHQSHDKLYTLNDLSVGMKISDPSIIGYFTNTGNYNEDELTTAMREIDKGILTIEKITTGKDVDIQVAVGEISVNQFLDRLNKGDIMVLQASSEKEKQTTQEREVAAMSPEE